MKIIDFIISRTFAIALLILSVLLLIFFKYFPHYYTNLILIFPLFIFISISLSLYRRVKLRSGKWSLSFFGSVLFHIGMLVVMGSIVSGGISRYWVNVTLPRNISVVVEGSPLTEVRGMPLFQEEPFIKLLLDWQDSTFAEGAYAIDHEAGIVIGLIDSDGYKETEEVLRINSPVWRGGYQFLLRSGGFVYMLIVRDKDGNILAEDYSVAPETLDLEDSFTIDEIGLEFHVRFFHEVFFENGKYGTRSLEALDPAVGVRIVSKDNPFEDAWKGLIRVRDTAKYNDYSIEFYDIRPYINIEILKDPSYYGIIVGWLLIVIGLFMRYLFIKDLNKEIG